MPTLGDVMEKVVREKKEIDDTLDEMVKRCRSFREKIKTLESEPTLYKPLGEGATETKEEQVSETDTKIKAAIAKTEDMLRRCEAQVEKDKKRAEVLSECITTYESMLESCNEGTMKMFHQCFLALKDTYC